MCLLLCVCVFLCVPMVIGSSFLHAVAPQASSVAPLCKIASRMLASDMVNIAELPSILNCFTNVMSNVGAIADAGM